MYKNDFVAKKSTWEYLVGSKGEPRRETLSYYDLNDLNIYFRVLPALLIGVPLVLISIYYDWSGISNSLTRGYNL